MVSESRLATVFVFCSFFLLRTLTDGSGRLGTVRVHSLFAMFIIDTICAQPSKRAKQSICTVLRERKAP